MLKRNLANLWNEYLIGAGMPANWTTIEIACELANKQRSSKVQSKPGDPDSMERAKVRPILIEGSTPFVWNFAVGTHPQF